MTTTPTVIELFAGGGGAATGLHRAGYKHLVSVEMWEPAVATLRAVGFPTIAGRVEDADLSRFAGKVTLLWASPPCQPYSSAGMRLGKLDPRDGWDGTLLRVRELRPRFVIIENVSGATVAAWAKQMKKDFDNVCSFDLTAEDFGVPQSRKRSFVYGGVATCDEFLRALAAQKKAPPAIDKLLPHLRGHYVRIEHTTAKARPASGASCPTLTTKGNVYVHKHDVGVRKPGFRIDRETSRPMTVDELSVIQGFPRDYPFAGSKSDAYRMIGNSVSPRVAEAIGKAILSVAGARRAA